MNVRKMMNKNSEQVRIKQVNLKNIFIFLNITIQ